MARLVSSVFQGARQIDVDPSRLSFRRVLQNAVGDVNMISDILFDSTAAPFVHSHKGKVSGVYTGTPLGIPLSHGGATWFGNILDQTSKAVTLGLILSSALVKVPFGEQKIVVSFARKRYDVPVYAFAQPVSSWVSPYFNADNVLLDVDDEVSTVLSAELTVTPNTLYHVGVYLQPLAPGTAVALPSSDEFIATLINPDAMIHFGRRGTTSPTYQLELRENATPPVLGVQTPGGATIPFVPMPQSGAVSDDMAYSAAHAGLINRAQNTLDEYVTGAPAGADDNGWTLVSNSTNSAYHDHSRRGSYKSNEPLCGLPVFAESSVIVDGIGDDAGYGYAAGSPPSSASYSVLAMFPDFPSTTTKLHVGAIVCYTGTGTPTCSIQMKTTAGVNVGSAVTPTMVQMGTSKLWYCDGTPASFTQDDLNRVDYTFARSGASGGIYAVARSAWFEP